MLGHLWFLHAARHPCVLVWVAVTRESCARGVVSLACSPSMLSPILGHLGYLHLGTSLEPPSSPSHGGFSKPPEGRDLDLYNPDMGPGQEGSEVIQILEGPMRGKAFLSF